MIGVRVSFVGPRPTQAAETAVKGAGGTWELSDCAADRPCQHSVLASAATVANAVEMVRVALTTHGPYYGFEGSPLRNAHGTVIRGPVSTTWEGIAWNATPEREQLSGLERRILGTMVNAAEPTWLIAADSAVAEDRRTVESGLRELQARGIVDCTTGEGGEPGKEREHDQWWAITDEGWDLLGIIKSPRYGGPD